MAFSFGKERRERFEQGTSNARETCRGHVSLARVRAGAAPASGESLRLRHKRQVVLIELPAFYYYLLPYVAIVRQLCYYFFG